MAIQLLSAVLRECNDLLGCDLDVEDNALLTGVSSAAWDELRGSEPSPSPWE